MTFDEYMLAIRYQRLSEIKLQLRTLGARDDYERKQLRLAQDRIGKLLSRARQAMDDVLEKQDWDKGECDGT